MLWYKGTRVGHLSPLIVDTCAHDGGLPGWAGVLVLCPPGGLGCEPLGLIRAYCRRLERARLTTQNVTRNSRPSVVRPRRLERHAGRV